MMLVPTFKVLVCNWYATFLSSLYHKKLCLFDWKCSQFVPTGMKKLCNSMSLLCKMLCFLCAITMKKDVSGEKSYVKTDYLQFLKQ